MKFENVLDSTSQYGPQGLLGRDGLLISTGYWANTQANILTGTGLPVSNEELETYLNLPDNVEISQDFQKLYDVYNEYKQLCDWWMENLFSCVLNMVNDINNVGSFASDIINSEMKISLQVMANDSNEQGRQEAAKQFQSTCLMLASELNQHPQYIKMVQNQLNFLLQGGNNCIGVRQLKSSFEKGIASLYSQYNGESEIHHSINMFLGLKKLLGTLVERHDINEKVKFRFDLGPLFGFIVSEILECSDIQSVKQQIDHFQNLLNNIDAQLSLEIKVLSLFLSINLDLDNVMAQAERSMEFIGQIEGIWRTIVNQFYSLEQGIENEDINKLSTDLDNAAATWEAVANKAKEFVTNSYQG